MKIDNSKVLGSSAAGDGRSRHYWSGYGDEDDVDYEALFRLFMERLFANRGAFKVDGSLLFEFVPKAKVMNQRLISSATAFCFHKFEEDGYLNDIDGYGMMGQDLQDGALDTVA